MSMMRYRIHWYRRHSKLLGQKDKALALIGQGIEYRLPLMVYIHVEPMLASLHDNPRFHELMTKVLSGSKKQASYI